MSESMTVSVMEYEPGHAGLQHLSQKVVEATKKHNPNRKFCIYKPVDKDGVAFCVAFNQNKVVDKALHKEHGDAQADQWHTDAKSGIKKLKSFDLDVSRCGNRDNGIDTSAPYLVVLQITYHPSKHTDLQQIRDAIRDADVMSKHSAIFKSDKLDNTFFISYPVKSLQALEADDGLLSHINDPEHKELLKKLEGCIESVEVTKLRLLPELSHIP